MNEHQIDPLDPELDAFFAAERECPAPSREIEERVLSRIKATVAGNGGSLAASVMNAPILEHLDAVIPRALAGDRAALSELCRRVLLPTIEAVVSRFLIGSRRWQHSVQDLTHEVLVHLLKDDRARLRRYDPARGALATYVQVVARSWLIDFFDKKPPPEPIELSDESSPPESKADLGQQLNRLLETLDEDDVLLFRWAFLENVERPEIARRLQISLDATHRRIQRLEVRALHILSSQGS